MTGLACRSCCPMILLASFIWTLLVSDMSPLVSFIMICIVDPGTHYPSLVMLNSPPHPHTTAHSPDIACITLTYR